MKFASVMIVTYGRSGSTLLQGLLNSMDGCLVRGENHNFCYGLFRAYDSLRRTRNEFGTAAVALPTDPWFGAGALNPGDFLLDCSVAIRRQLLGGQDPQGLRCLGFKEIRYTGLPDLEDYLAFLEHVMPSPAFVFLTREHASVARSGWWRDQSPADVHAELAAFEQRTSAFAAQRGNCFRIDYADMVNQRQPLEDLFAFLGARYDAEEVRRVLSVTHSYVDGGKAGALKLTHLAFDPLPETASYDALVVGGVAVINGEGAEDAVLVASCLGNRCEVTWHVPSPVVAALFADNPRAQSARFSVDVRACPPGSELLLEVVMPDKSRVEVGRCRLPGQAVP